MSSSSSSSRPPERTPMLTPNDVMEQEEESSSRNAPFSSFWDAPNHFLQNILTKSKEMPHAFVEGYGSIMETFAESDSAEVKTSSRKLVEKFWSKYEWYFPQKRLHSHNPDPPSLSEAWAYYEHITLPRHYVGEGIADEALHRAEPGETAETKLYNPFWTPQSALMEWGTGVDLYFISLKFFAGLLFVAGLMNSGSMRYYASAKYNGERPVTKMLWEDETTTDFILQGSAVCTNTDWVVCEDCSKDEWVLDKSRYATAVDGTILVLRNLCQGATTVNGVANFTTLLFLLVSFFVFSYYLRQREVRFDEDKVTTTDYSLIVQNPPKDAMDPDEWRRFFEQFTPEGAQVTVVTIALNNEKLLQKLIQRRKLRRTLKLKLHANVDLDDETEVSQEIENYRLERLQQNVGWFGKLLAADPKKIVDKIARITREIEALQQKTYHVSKVFVTFETENAQRAALRSLTVGKVHVYRNNTAKMAPGHVFRGKVLKVREPCEPSAVRWLDLSASLTKKVTGRLTTFVLTLGILLVASFGITKARASAGPSLSGPLTSLANVLIPNVIKGLMVLETHSTEGGYQTSLYLKVTLFRWTLAGILTMIITPFTSTLSPEKTDLLPTISHILLADVWIVPLVKLLNIGPNVRKHILAPRARTQEEMNMHFQGTHYNLGERYTDLTKVLFVVFFYSALFPAGFFFGALILTIQYFVDKFSLMRLWGWSPLIGAQLASFSRRYFFTAALITLALISSFTWAQFPYDNICTDSDSTASKNGTYTGVSTLNGDLVNGLGVVDVTQGNSVRFCSQSWADTMGMSLPKLPEVVEENGFWHISIEEREMPWMTSSQAWLTTIYGWIATIVVVVFVSIVLAKFVRRILLSFVANTYQPDGDSQNIDFSSDPDIFAYVPQIKIKGFAFPFLACDISRIDHGLIGWEDQYGGYDMHNLSLDVMNPTGSSAGNYHEVEPLLGGGTTGISGTESRPVFSIIKHYPTSWQYELAKQNKFGLGKKNI